MKETNTCVFCDIVENGSDLISNAILYEDDDFFIVPAVGAIVPGYLMLVSKDHLYSMCYLSDEKRARLTNIISNLSSIYIAKYGFAPLIFEHGASLDCSNLSACCLVHAHMHIVPHYFSAIEDMKNKLELCQIDSLEEFFQECHEKSYLFFANNDGRIFLRVFTDDAVPSQIFRQWVAADVGVLGKWDWRIHRFDENIYKTVIDVGNLLYKANLSNKRTLLKSIYYGRAMDGLSEEDIIAEYAMISKRLNENGMNLVNPFTGKHLSYAIDKSSGRIVARDNWSDMDKSDCVVINLSIKGHLYIGCIDEIVVASQKGRFVIVITGDAGADKHYYLHFRADKIVKTIDDALEFLIDNNKSS